MTEREGITTKYENNSREILLCRYVMRFIGEDVLYEDENIICFTFPGSLGMVEIDKNTIGEHIRNAIKRMPHHCARDLTDNIKREIAYWGIGYTCDDADAFLVEHGCEPYDWRSRLDNIWANHVRKTKNAPNKNGASVSETPRERR